MSDIPKFTHGQVGKLDAKAMNKIAQYVNRSNTSEQVATPTSKNKAGVAQYPIVAMLGDRVDVSEKDAYPYFGGYEWAEVKYNIETGVWPDTDIDYADSLRAYHPSAGNAAYGLGLTVGYGPAGNPFQQPEFFPDYAGKIVHLFPSRSSTGVPMLTFQPPPERTTYVAEIIGYPTGSEACNIVSSDSSIANLHLYQLRVGTVSGFDGDGAGSFDFVESDLSGSNRSIGVNLIEMNGENNLGHTLINDEQSCEGGTTLSRTPLPIGTKVVATRMFRSYTGNPNYSHDDIYMFNVTNELCVGCCGTTGSFDPQARTTVVRRRDMQNISRIERYQGDILREMAK